MLGCILAGSIDPSTCLVDPTVDLVCSNLSFELSFLQRCVREITAILEESILFVSVCSSE